MTVALSAFWQDVLANVIAGAVVLIAGAVLVNIILYRRDRERERRERKQEALLERKEREIDALEAEQARKKAALSSVKLELKWNQEQLKELLNDWEQHKKRRIEILKDTQLSLQQRDDLIAKLPLEVAPSPFFTTSGWDLVRQESILTTLLPANIEMLSAAYRMFDLVNEVHRLVAEHSHGATATLIEFAGILQGRPGLVKDEYTKHQSWYFEQLVKQLEGLESESLVADAIRSSDSELERAEKIGHHLSLQREGVHREREAEGSS